MDIPASASRMKPIICSSVSRFFMSNFRMWLIGLQSHMLLNTRGRRNVSNYQGSVVSDEREMLLSLMIFPCSSTTTLSAIAIVSGL